MGQPERATSLELERWYLVLALVLLPDGLGLTTRGTGRHHR